jgi:hypothetical protein
MTRARGVVSVGHQAERKNAMQQVIVSRNDNEEVWVATPTGHLLAECFFKAADETPEEVEHMGYPRLTSRGCTDQTPPSDAGQP